MSEMKLCKDCGHYNNWNGDCDVVRIDPVKGDGQKLFATTSRWFYCGVVEARDFKAKDQPKPKEPERKGCPFCWGICFEHGIVNIRCGGCGVIFQFPGETYEIRWNHFNRRAEDRLPEIKKCQCGGNAYTESNGSGFVVKCSVCVKYGIWAKTQRGAIENWNG